MTFFQKKNQKLKAALLLCVIAAGLLSVIAVPRFVSAADIEQVKPVELSGTLIGKYQLNYTGNLNYFNSATPSYELSGKNRTFAEEKKRLANEGHVTAFRGYENSSTSKLSNSYGGSGKIAKAYLVWQSRSSSAGTVTLLTPDGKEHTVKANKKYHDLRPGDTNLGDKGQISCMYSYAKDVTNLVKKKPYGKYSVCDIKEWTYDGHGGESMCTWQLVVVEHVKDEAAPVRAVDVRLGAYFSYLSDDWVDMKILLEHGLMTKSAGTVTGQVIYGFQSDSLNAGKWPVTVKVGNTDSVTLNNRKISSGLYRNDTVLVGNQGSTRFTLCDSAAEGGKINLGNGAKGVQAIIENPNGNWNSYYLLGTAIDVEFPYTQDMKTTVNSASSVTVSNTITNNISTSNGKTGIYDGEIVVELDDALTATAASATKADGTALVSSAIKIDNASHTVTFTGLDTLQKGKKVSYTIACTTDSVANSKNGVKVFTNTDSYSGKLYDGTAQKASERKTGLAIGEVIFGESSDVPMYTVTVIPGEHIKSVMAGGQTKESTLAVDYKIDGSVSVTATPENGCEFTKWTRKNEGTGSTGDKKSNPYTFTMPSQNVTLTAEGKIIERTVTLRAGEGIASVSGGGKYKVGTKVSITATLKEGYHFRDWTGTYQTGEIDYSFTMPAQDVDMTANAEVNQYTIHFHPNDGAELSHVDDIVAEYGQEITLPNIIASDGTAAYVKYTLDGENVTEGVLSGTIPESMMYGYTEPEQEEEASETGQPEDEEEGAETEPSEGEAEASEEEQLEETEPEPVESEIEALETEDETEASGTEPESKEKVAGTELTGEETNPQPTVYPSVFLGWALEENKDKPTAQWKADETVKNLVKEHGGEITLYAVWDDCPWIVAEDLYYTLEEAQNGFITEAEILSHATASDREDGSPINPGFHEDGTSFSIPDYRAEDFTGLSANPDYAEIFEIKETLTVVDSVGSMYSKEITVYVVDTTPQPVKPEGTTRFIDEYYYHQPYENGGLEDNSVWKTDPEYVETITEAFENLKNDTPVMEFHFTHEDVLKAKEYIQEHGIGNSKEPDGLSNFYDTFLEPNRTK